MFCVVNKHLANEIFSRIQPQFDMQANDSDIMLKKYKNFTRLAQPRFELL